MKALPEHAGCLMFAAMNIRNFYGMWHADNPHTEAEDVEITDGIVTDQRMCPDPENLIARFGSEFEKLVLTTLMSPWPRDGALDPEVAAQSVTDRRARSFDPLPRSG